MRHYAGFFSPDAAAAMPVVLERDNLLRLRRLTATVGDRTGQRIRPTRPRMRALVASAGGRLRWRDVPAPPAPGPLGAIVHPVAASTCDLDCPLTLGATQLALPLHLGHECVAEVIAVGERVSTVRVGDRVVVPFQINCGACEPCRDGRTGSCTGVPPISMYGMGVTAGHWGGAFSDQLAVPYADAMLVPLPNGIDPVAAASVADNICDAYRHIAPHLPLLLQKDPSAEVLILAATNRKTLFTASLPLYTGLIARAYGARNITLADVRPRIRDHAQHLGFDAVHPRELRRRRPAPLVADVNTNPGLALANTAPDGICSSAGGLHRSAGIPLLRMYVRNAAFYVGRTHARALIPEVLSMMVDGRLHPESIPMNVAPLDDAVSVLREHFTSGEGVKTVLTSS
jgi:alcohol dehydrogenase